MNFEKTLIYSYENVEHVENNHHMCEEKYRIGKKKNVLNNKHKSQNFLNRSEYLLRIKFKYLNTNRMFFILYN